NLWMIKSDESFSYAKDLFILQIIFSLLLASVGEEIMYRGFVQPYVNEKIRRKQMLISSGKLFASGIMLMTHLGFFIVMPFEFACSSLLLVSIFSLSMGYLKDQTGSLLMPVFCHLSVNS